MAKKRIKRATVGEKEATKTICRKKPIRRRRRKKSLLEQILG